MSNLQNNNSDIKTMAETAMMQAASYGSGLELIARLSMATTPEALATELIRHLANQGFFAAVQLRSSGEVYSVGADGVQCSGVELQIFDLLKSHGRIYQFGKRTIFNDEHISILVKNMPQSGSATYDTTLDSIAKLVPALNKRFVSLVEHRALLDVKTWLSDAIDLIEENVCQVEKEHKQMMDAIETKVSMGFHKLHLDEEQERYFMNIIDEEIRHRQKNQSIVQTRKVISDCVSALRAVDHAKQLESHAMGEDNPDIELF